MRARDETPGAAAGGETERVLERVREALRGLRFGTVTLVVQDGVVVQIDRTEKMRLPGRAPPER